MMSSTLQPEKSPVTREMPRWRIVFAQFKKELLEHLSREKRAAVDMPDARMGPYRDTLSFLSDILQRLEPGMALEHRPPEAEKALTFECFTWTEADRTWLDTYATFSHTSSLDQLIVFLPGRDKQERIQEMAKSLQTMGCSTALRKILRKQVPTGQNAGRGQYVWFWNAG